MMTSSPSRTSLELVSVTRTSSTPERRHSTQPNPSEDERNDNAEQGVNISQLPPADGGSAAWRLLAAFFVFEALMWGFPLSYGVFQEYYSHLPQFAGNPYISVVGTVASGISYLGAPFITPFIRRYSRYRRQMILVGWPICILSLVAGSFAHSLTSLILTQGVLYGLGFVTFYYPILSMVDEFWIRRRGMAYGLLCSASGLSGTVMPLVNQALLRKYGYPTTLRAIAIALLITTGPLIPMLKPRLPPSTFTTQHISLRALDFSFLTSPLFWIYNLANVLMGLGYFFPSLYLPSYATALGLSPLKAALLLTVMSISQVLGQFTFGYLSDLHLRPHIDAHRRHRFLPKIQLRIPLDVLLTIPLIISATATLTSWPLASSFAPLLLFAVIYGFFASGFTALWARMATAIAGKSGSKRSSGRGRTRSGSRTTINDNSSSRRTNTINSATNNNDNVSTTTPNNNDANNTIPLSSPTTDHDDATITITPNNPSSTNNDISTTANPTTPATIFSLLNFGKGIGNVLAGPLSAALLRPPSSISLGYGMRYRGIVIFTGVCLFGSALIVGSWYIRPKVWRRWWRAMER